MMWDHVFCVFGNSLHQIHTEWKPIKTRTKLYFRIFLLYTFWRRLEWRKRNVWKLVDHCLCWKITCLEQLKWQKEQTVGAMFCSRPVSRPVKFWGPTHTIVDLLANRQRSKFKDEFWDKRSWVTNSCSIPVCFQSCFVFVTDPMSLTCDQWLHVRL